MIKKIKYTFILLILSFILVGELKDNKGDMRYTSIILNNISYDGHFKIFINKY